jgi:hypothetical protein
MKGYGMGNKDHMAERAKRLAERYPDRKPPLPEGPVIHVIVDSEDFEVTATAIESAGDVTDDEPEKKKGGRPKGSKNKAKD